MDGKTQRTVTTTTTVTLTEDEVSEILRNHFGMRSAVVTFETGYDSLREVTLTTTEHEDD